MAARALIIDTINEETGGIEEQAKKAISQMERKYFLSPNSVNAEVFIKLTDNWIELAARYINPVRQRRATRSRISQKILEKIEKSEDIRIASKTVDIVGFPEAGFNLLH